MYGAAIARLRPDLRVLALDEQPAMLERVAARVASDGLANLEPIAPAALEALRGRVDRVLALNVLHELGDDALSALIALLHPAGTARDRLERRGRTSRRTAARARLRTAGGARPAGACRRPDGAGGVVPVPPRVLRAATGVNRCRGDRRTRRGDPRVLPTVQHLRGAPAMEQAIDLLHPLQDRIAECLLYSMNGRPAAYTSPRDGSTHRLHRIPLER